MFDDNDSEFRRRRRQARVAAANPGVAGPPYAAATKAGRRLFEAQDVLRVTFTIPIDDFHCPLCGEDVHWSCSPTDYGSGYADCANGLRVTRLHPPTGEPCKWDGCRLIRIGNDVFAPASTGTNVPYQPCSKLQGYRNRNTKWSVSSHMSCLPWKWRSNWRWCAG